jgi:hypothetical protein
MNINWKHIDKEKPIDRQRVWVITSHWKRNFPGSFRICSGEVEYGNDGSYRVNTCDDFGEGLFCFYPNIKQNRSFDELFDYWCDQYEINFPNEKQEQGDKYDPI